MGKYETKEEVAKRVLADNDMSKIKKIMPIEKPIIDFKDRQLRVAVYCRVSTDSVSQAVSFNLQKKHYINYVRSNPNWKLVALYSDEGKSATTTKGRVGLQMMVEDAKKGKFDLIITKSISRLSRNLADSVRITRELKSLPKPVAIFFETEQMDTFNPTMTLIINILAIVAEEESKKKSESITASYRQRYEGGSFTVPASLGYRRTGVNTIDIDQDEAETVRIIYKMYLAGFSPEEIANTLIDLSRPKHTHVSLNGSIKYGSVNWDSKSVLRVFDNEKKCGDVLAQKTYTVDCMEHTTRKNNRDVVQYYGVDQHPAIISRDDFYLALKLKRANRNGWRSGIQVLHTYVSGVLKGYVVTIPKWHGYSACDYMRASLHGYGVNPEKESLYPDYVTSGMTESRVDNKVSDHEMEHLYLISDEEFNSGSDLTEEEKEVINSEAEDNNDEIDDLRKMIKFKPRATDYKYSPVSARLFFAGEKPYVTFDRNGLSFSKNCFSRLCKNIKSEDIEVLYNPVVNRIVIRKSCVFTNEHTKLRWCAIDQSKVKMKRCSAPSLTDAIYRCMKWDKCNKYRVYGEIKEIDGEKVLSFCLEDPVVKVKASPDKAVKNKVSDQIDISIISSDEIIEPEHDNEAKTEINEETSSVRGDNRSKAVIFREGLAEENVIDINAFGEKKYDPLFIKGIIISNLEPRDGWEYLDGLIKWVPGGFELFSPRWKDSLNSYKNHWELSAEKCTYEDFGWPLDYTFPDKQEVMTEINKMKQIVC